MTILMTMPPLVLIVIGSAALIQTAESTRSAVWTPALDSVGARQVLGELWGKAQALTGRMFPVTVCVIKIRLRV
ncbi:hypothetical protein R0135_05995 [Congregibacter variabilis]|uniref:Secreted protein n=1 Tax=Congregibacter variabilis TaxID=3081200 RepID=A0ABZ0I6Q7_9GAMM|nr:hypothetical protein R0135_05995 [Congregibacter sp. IMCC43200]